MDYKKRLLQEFAELVEKITRLRVFIEHQEYSEENLNRLRNNRLGQPFGIYSVAFIYTEKGINKD